MEFKYGIFDLDGTIFDAMPAYAKIYSRILNDRFGILPENSVGYYLESAGTPLNEQFRYMLEATNKPKDKIPEMVKEFFDLVGKENFSLFDGAKKVLEDLHNKGVKLFVTTGSEDSLTAKRLDRAGISRYFSLVLGSSQKEKGPWHIERFARSIKVPIDEFSKLAFYIGDGPFDMHLAKMFGIYAIGIPTTVSKNLLLESGADEVVEKISDIGKLKKISG